MDEQIIRDNIVNLLKGGQAYMTFEEAIKDFPLKAMNTLFPNGTYSSWHLLEHIRLTQYDILNFMINQKYKEPKWPQDYWPTPGKEATKKDWDKTIEQFLHDRKQLEHMVMDKKLILTAKVPNGSGQTFVREFFVVADHTSYHLGEFAIMRQTLGTWKK